MTTTTLLPGTHRVQEFLLTQGELALIERVLAGNVPLGHGQVVN